MLIWYFSNNMIMLENCQNNILVYGCSPMQGTTFYSCGNLIKPGSQSGTYILPYQIQRKILQYNMLFCKKFGQTCSTQKRKTKKRSSQYFHDLRGARENLKHNKQLVPLRKLVNYQKYIFVLNK